MTNPTVTEVLAERQREAERRVIEWAGEAFAALAALRDSGITNNQIEEAYREGAVCLNALPKKGLAPISMPPEAAYFNSLNRS